MRLRARLTVFIVTAWLLVTTPMTSATAADVESESTPVRITPSMVVDLVDDHGPDGDHIDHSTVGGPDAPTEAVDRVEAAEQAAEILADVKARLEAAPSAPSQQARQAQFTAAIAGRAGAAGFSVAYDPSFPTPSSAKAAIEAAVQTWDDTLDTDSAPVVVWVVWKSLGNSRILGSGGPYELRSRNGLPTDYYYPAPLVNTLTGADQNGTNPEIVIVLNKDLAASGAWHYGSSSPPGGKIDLQSVVLHEVGHGVGFVSSASNESGPIAFSDPPFIYDAQGVYQGGLVINTANVTTALTSGNVSIKIGNSRRRDVYTPSTWQQGTSFSHFEPDSGSLMEPSLDSGSTTRVVDSGTLGLLRMIGWPADLNVTGPPTVTTRALDGQIERVYLAHLRRGPDNAGFTFWLNQRARGLTLLAMITEFQSSTEFVANLRVVEQHPVRDADLQQRTGPQPRQRRPGPLEGHARQRNVAGRGHRGVHRVDRVRADHRDRRTVLDGRGPGPAALPRLLRPGGRNVGRGLLDRSVLRRDDTYLDRRLLLDVDRVRHQVRQPE